MMGGGREVMNCDGCAEEFTETVVESQMPTSPFCAVSRVEAAPVASLNMPSGFKSQMKREDRSLTELSADRGFAGAMAGDGPVSTWLTFKGRTPFSPAEWTEAPSRADVTEMVPGLYRVNTKPCSKHHEDGGKT